MAGWSPDLSWLTERLAVGGAFPPERAAEIVRDHRVSAVVDLRSEACDEAQTLQALGVAFLHLPTDDLCAVPPDDLEAGVAFAGARMSSGGRVLVHCQHGIGRAPTLALSILVDQGWDPLQALARAKDLRPRVSPSPQQYEAWAAWLRARRPAPDVPDFDAFKAIAYRHLAASA